MSCRFAIVEDCAEERGLYVEYLTSACRLRCVGAYPNAEQALREIPSKRPDVVLMDLGLPGMSGIECAQRLKRFLPKVRIVMITGVAKLDSAKESAEKGADGYVTKPFSMKELREAIRFALAGGVPVSRSIWDQFAEPPAYSAKPDPALVKRLTPKERKLMELLDAGLSYKQLADRLEIRLGTVQQHLHHIYKKLSVPSRNEAVNKYFGRMGADPSST